MYVDAARRHLELYASGEDVDLETGVSHLGHLVATCAILADAAACGTLRDDRARSDLRGAMDAAQALMATWPGSATLRVSPHVAATRRR